MLRSACRFSYFRSPSIISNQMNALPLPLPLPLPINNCGLLRLAYRSRSRHITTESRSEILQFVLRTQFIGGMLIGVAIGGISTSFMKKRPTVNQEVQDITVRVISNILIQTLRTQIELHKTHPQIIALSTNYNALSSRFIELHEETENVDATKELALQIEGLKLLKEIREVLNSI